MNPKYLAGVKTYLLSKLTEDVQDFKDEVEMGPLVYIHSPNPDPTQGHGGMLVEVDTMARGTNGKMYGAGRVAFASTGTARARAEFPLDRCSGVIVESPYKRQPKWGTLIVIYWCLIAFLWLGSAMEIVLWAHDRADLGDLFCSFFNTILLTLLCWVQTQGPRMRKRFLKAVRENQKAVSLTVTIEPEGE